MDAILLTVTGISVALAAVMGVLLIRMLREERRRSDARVALLSELAEQPSPASANLHAEAYRATISPQRRYVEPERPASAQPRPIVEHSRRANDAEPQVWTKPSRLLVLEDLELRPSTEQDVTVAHDLFEEQGEPSAWPRRLAVIGSLTAAIAVLVLGWSAFSQRQTAPATTATDLAEAIIEAPLELLSLRHAQQDGMFTITGLVQNPRTGRDLSRVKATLFVFGPGGAFITSGRAPLDFTTLRPGDESPFVIRVPVKGDVARYRIGFRGDDDRVLAHVDRRPTDAIAQK